MGDWRSGPRASAPSPPRGDRDRGYGGDRDGGRRGFDRYEAPRDRGYGDRGGDRGGCLFFLHLSQFLVVSIWDEG